MPTLFVAGVPLTEGRFSKELLEAVKDAELLAAEERKNALRLLAAADKRELPYIIINEHSAAKDSREAAKTVAALSGNAIFVTDTGTPCVADPDYRFVDSCIKLGVTVRSLPGASSITAALSVSGFDASRFIFLGFPPKSGKEREEFFLKLAKLTCTGVFLERPYALERTLKDIGSLYVSVSVNLGSGEEMNLRGAARELSAKAKGLKAPFTVCVPAKTKDNSCRGQKARQSGKNNVRE